MFLLCRSTLFCHIFQKMFKTIEQSTFLNYNVKTGWLIMPNSAGRLNNSELKLKRDTFRTKFGFIWACVGSAVGIGTVWMFPYRLGQYGGAVFLIEYIIFTVLLGLPGVIGEMAFGRAMKSGPIGAFADATKMKFNYSFGKFLGVIPALGALCIAIGYSVVVGWIIRFLASSISGELLQRKDTVVLFANISGDFGNVVSHLVGFLIVFFIMIFGISNGIEKLNKILMPLFFILFMILAIKAAFLPGSFRGYTYLFDFDFAEFLEPQNWIYALGQAFFSLSLAGSGTLIYGSYLKDDEDIIYCAKNVALFDVLAGVIAALAIIPAMFSFGLESQAGPSLLFVAMPQVFAGMPFGRFFEIIFFTAILFAAVTSIINLFEVPIEGLQANLKLPRSLAVTIVIATSAVISLFIENGETVGKWMDIVSMYVITLGTLLAGVMFFWVCGSDFAIENINKGARKKLNSRWFILLSKYVFIIGTLIIFVCGLFFKIS